MGEFFSGIWDEFNQSQDRKALVFIHGFNVQFDAAVRRTAQIAFDWNFDGPAILYSWPSRGRVRHYPADEENVRESAVRLAAFFHDLNRHVGTDSVVVIAHSMGNRAVTDALELALRDDPSLRFDKVVLAAPDVPIPRFRRFAAAVGGMTKNLTVYTSSQDRALRLSRRLHDHPRVGETVVVMPDIDTIDASEVQTSDLLGHGYFGESRELLADIHQLFNGRAAHQRFGLVAQKGEDGIFYRFRR
jgi:esterase/lipase superfamily enzyme